MIHGHPAGQLEYRAGRAFKQYANENVEYLRDEDHFWRGSMLAVELDRVSNHNAGFWKRLQHLSGTWSDDAQYANDLALACAASLWDEYVDLRELTWNQQGELERRPVREVVRYDPRPPRRLITTAMRQEIFERDGHRCLSCGSDEHLQIDHIVPFSQGGPCEVENFQTLCRSCNASKGARFLDLRSFEKEAQAA